MLWFLLTVSALLLSGSQAKTVKVSVYYEGLCPYSVQFFENQLNPNYEDLKGRVELELVPFGKANITREGGKYIFTCQHGPAECYGSKVHSCALYLAPGEKGMKFAMCSMASPNATQDEYLEKCAEKNQISWNDLYKCAKSVKGDELLAANGQKTYSLHPKLANVPTVVLDGNFQESLSAIARNNFVHLVEFILSGEECRWCQK